MDKLHFDCRDILVQFMTRKGYKIKTIIGWERYFTKEDARAIYQLTPQEAALIYSRLSDSIYGKNQAFDAYLDTCVFCLLHQPDIYGSTVCGACAYGKNHGICKSLSSDYQKFIAPAKILSKKLSNEFYCQSLKEIRYMIGKILGVTSGNQYNKEVLDY